MSRSTDHLLGCNTMNISAPRHWEWTRTNGGDHEVFRTFQTVDAPNREHCIRPVTRRAGGLTTERNPYGESRSPGSAQEHILFVGIFENREVGMIAARGIWKEKIKGMKEMKADGQEECTSACWLDVGDLSDPLLLSLVLKYAGTPHRKP